MHSNNCCIITVHKIPGAQPSLFYPFKRATPSKNALPSHTQKFQSSAFVTRKDKGINSQRKAIIRHNQAFCCKHLLLIHVESWTFSHVKEACLRENLNQARPKLAFFSFLDVWHHNYGIYRVGKRWLWNPKSPPAILWPKDCSVPCSCVNRLL